MREGTKKKGVREIEKGGKEEERSCQQEMQPGLCV